MTPTVVGIVVSVLMLAASVAVLAASAHYTRRATHARILSKLAADEAEEALAEVRLLASRRSMTESEVEEFKRRWAETSSRPAAWRA